MKTKLIDEDRLEVSEAVEEGLDVAVAALAEAVTEAVIKQPLMMAVAEVELSEVGIAPTEAAVPLLYKAAAAVAEAVIVTQVAVIILKVLINPPLQFRVAMDHMRHITAPLLSHHHSVVKAKPTTPPTKHPTTPHQALDLYRDLHPNK